MKQSNESSPQVCDSHTENDRGPQNSSSKQSNRTDEGVQYISNGLDLSSEEGTDVRSEVSDEEGDGDADRGDDLNRCVNC